MLSQSLLLRTPLGGQCNLIPAVQTFSQKCAYARPHLHARAFTSERKPASDSQQSTDKFHGYQAQRRRTEFAFRNCLHMRNAASGRVR